MERIFFQLLDNTIAEICRREPAYLSLFPIAFSREPITSSYPLWDQLPSDAAGRALAEGYEYIARNNQKGVPQCVTDQAMMDFVRGSVMDAFCAERGLLDLRPAATPGLTVPEILANHYSQRRTSAGLLYYVRNTGTRPLLLVNATGTPIESWSLFLADATHDLQIILPQRWGTDLFRGGLLQSVDLLAESQHLLGVLDAESVRRVDVLAWCNGARVGIDLVNRLRDRASSLVLLGAMFKGTSGVAPGPSAFERDLQPLLDNVMQQPALAPMLSKAVSQRSMTPDWARWKNDPETRARVLFALPAKDYACGMMAPLAYPESLLNIARRVASDESNPTDQALRELTVPTMVILGSDDNVVSNSVALAALKQNCRQRVHVAVVNGSGHYVHDLQYQYFRWLLTGFLDGSELPERTGRVTVETFGSVTHRLPGGVSQTTA